MAEQETQRTGRLKPEDVVGAHLSVPFDYYKIPHFLPNALGIQGNVWEYKVVTPGYSF